MSTQQAPESPGRRATRDHDPLTWRLLAVALAGSALLLLLSLVTNARGGWSVWKQGDWLINSINGAVRRGPTGSAIIEASDALGVSPITVVVGLQVVLLVTLYAAWYVAVRGLPDPRLAVLLTCSPAMFLVIWPANVYDGALRKELLAMAALALVLVHLRSATGGRLWALVAGGVVMAAGVWAHEIVLLFVPAFAYLAWLAWRRPEASAVGRRVVVAVVAVVAVSSLLAGLYTLQHSGTTAIGPVCQPLVERGLDRDRICTGPFRWLTLDSGHSMELVRNRNASASGLTRFAAVLVISLAPLAYVVSLLDRRRAALLGAVAALPMLPLFGLVIDWGRWLSCGVFAFAAVVTAEVLTGRAGLRRRPAFGAVVGLLVLCCLVAPYHVDDVVLGGALSKVRGVVGDVVNAF